MAPQDKEVADVCEEETERLQNPNMLFLLSCSLYMISNLGLRFAPPDVMTFQIPTLAVFWHVPCVYMYQRLAKCPSSCMSLALSLSLFLCPSIPICS